MRRRWSWVNHLLDHGVFHGVSPARPVSSNTLKVHVKYKVLAWNSRWRSPIGLTKSDLLTSLSHGTADSAVLSCIGSQWALCSTFKYMTSACCSSWSMLQKPSTFPSSTCIDLLWGDSCMLYGGYSIYVIQVCAAAVFLACSQQQQRADVFSQNQTH